MAEKKQTYHYCVQCKKEGVTRRIKKADYEQDGFCAEHRSAREESSNTCLCGCGGTPKLKKSKFMPGHDARYLSAQKGKQKVAK